MFIKNKRVVAEQLINELFRYNDRDDCFDPIGSIDSSAMLNLIEDVSRGSLKDISKNEAKGKFNRLRKVLNWEYNELKQSYKRRFSF